MKIFKQTHQKRPEAKVNLGGHQTNKVKMISIHFWGTPTKLTLEDYNSITFLANKLARKVYGKISL